MSLPKLVCTALLTVGVLGACGDKKPKELKLDATTVEKAAAELKKEAAETEAKLKAAKKRVADSLKKVDSLRQVKEHGHAH